MFICIEKSSQTRVEVKRSAVTAVLAALAFLSDNASGFAADAQHGKLIALRVCSICHSVMKADVAGDHLGPSFRSIAKSRQFRKKGEALLFETHPKMPTLALTREEADDVTAYIILLGK